MDCGGGGGGGGYVKVYSKRALIKNHDPPPLCLSVSMPVCLSTRLNVCLSVCLLVCECAGMKVSL